METFKQVGARRAANPSYKPKPQVCENASGTAYIMTPSGTTRKGK